MTKGREPLRRYTLEVVVEGENLREAQALGSRYQRGVGEVHRSVLILFHQYR